MDPKDETIAQLRARVAELENTVKLRDLEIMDLKNRVERSRPGYVINSSTPFPLLNITHQDFKKVLKKVRYPRLSTTFQLSLVPYVRLFQTNKTVYNIMEEIHPTLRKNTGMDISFIAYFNLSQPRISGGWTINMDRVMLPGRSNQFKEKFCKPRKGFRFQNIVFVSPGIQQNDLEKLGDAATTALLCFGEFGITCDTLNTNGMIPLQEMFDVLKPNYFRVNGMIPGRPFFQDINVKGVQHVSLGAALAEPDIYAVLDEQIFEDCHDIHLEVAPPKTAGIFDRIFRFMMRLAVTKKSKSIRAVGSFPPDFTPVTCFPNIEDVVVSRGNGLAWFFMHRADPGVVVTFICYSAPSFLELNCRYCKNWQEFMTHFRSKVGRREEELREFFQ